MDDLLTIELEAHNDERNHHRRYMVTVGRDLLGAWTVSIRYGRAGGRLRCLRFGDSDEKKMQRIVHERLRRRLSAPRRIGCPYRLSSMDMAQGFAAAGWLPAATIGRFLATEAPQAR